MDAEKERIIARIEKLMAIVNDKSDSEAESAMMLAQKLMAEYHLTEADISTEDKEEAVIKETMDIGSRNNGWKRYLAIVIARNFRCATYYTVARRDYRHGGNVHGQIVTFLGEEADAKLAKQTFHFAVENGEYRYKDFSKQNDVDKYDRITFYTSYVQGIASKFEEQKAANQQWGLVLVQPAAVAKEFESMHTHTTHNNNIGIYTHSNAAKAAGYAAGRAFNAGAGVLR